jgi:hypothetical protein
LSNPLNLLSLHLATLEQLGYGNAARQFQALLRHCVEDCKSRPTVGKPRVVTMKFMVTPKSHEEEDPLRDGQRIQVFDGAGIKIAFDIKMPTRSTIEYDCGVNLDGDLVFNPTSPLNHRQASLPGFLEQPAAEPQAQAAP